MSPARGQPIIIVLPPGSGPAFWAPPSGGAQAPFVPSTFYNPPSTGSRDIGILPPLYFPDYVMPNFGSDHPPPGVSQPSPGVPVPIFNTPSSSDSGGIVITPPLTPRESAYVPDFARDRPSPPGVRVPVTISPGMYPPVVPTQIPGQPLVVQAPPRGGTAYWAPQPGHAHIIIPPPLSPEEEGAYVPDFARDRPSAGVYQPPLPEMAGPSRSSRDDEQSISSPRSPSVTSRHVPVPPSGDNISQPALEQQPVLRTQTPSRLSVRSPSERPDIRHRLKIDTSNLARS